MGHGSPPVVLASPHVQRGAGAGVRSLVCADARLNSASRDALSIFFFLRELVYALMR